MGPRRWAPGLAAARDYEPAWFREDLLAGLVLTAVLVPVGMGYAEAAGLPAITGLYATIVPLVAYAVFGPSRIMVLGPDSALAALVAAAVLPLAAGSTERAVALAGMLAILTGVLCALAGFLKVGFLTDLLSTPIRYGYLNGIALTVLVGQLPKVLGFPAEGPGLLGAIAGLARGIAAGLTNAAACAIGLGSLAVILGLRRWAPRVPGAAIAVAAGTLAAAGFDLGAKAGLSVVGALPRGLPAFRAPDVSLPEIQALAPAAVAIALVSLADMSVLSRAFAARSGGVTNTDQELLALGAANVATGVFQGFPVASSASRTPVAESAGAKTQATGLVGALGVALLLVGAPGLLRNLPHAVLGAVVIAACLGLVEVRGVLRLYRLRRGEFAISGVCFLGVALLGVTQGIFLAVGIALLAFVWRAWRPYDAVLGVVDGLRGYHDVSRHPDARRIPGLVLFRWDAPLFFANAETFRAHVLGAAAGAPTPTKWVVVAAEPVTDVDITAADALAALDETLHAAGIELCFAEMKGPVKDRLKTYGLFNQFGTESFFPTLGQAVDAYRAKFQIEV